jgi:hypothetical protein
MQVCDVRATTGEPRDVSTLAARLTSLTSGARTTMVARLTRVISSRSKSDRMTIILHWIGSRIIPK